MPKRTLKFEKLFKGENKTIKLKDTLSFLNFEIDKYK